MLPIRYIIIVIALFPALTQGQTFQHAVLFGSNISNYTSSHPDAYPIKYKKTRPVKYEDYAGIGGSVGYKLEYQFPKSLMVGSSIEFLYTQARLITPCYCNHTMDRTITTSNSISTYSVDFPIFFKLRTNKINYTYFSGGLGMNMLLSANRRVETVVNILTSPPKTIITETANGAFSLKNTNNNGLGTFFYLGIGQSFRIRKINFFTELSYRQDLNSWIYKTTETPDGVKEFPIKRHGVNLKIGVILKSIDEKKE